MPLRDRLLIIGLVIAAPIIAVAAGVSQAAGLLIGIGLTAGGLAWMVLGARS